MKEKIERYLIELKTASNAKNARQKKTRKALVSSLKISEVTEYTIDEIEIFLNESSKVKFSLVNSNMNIYEIL